jgi:hypothetical protein
VLTAAEMGASHCFSTIAVRENNVLNGDLEQMIVDGVSDILGKLPSMPPAVLLYTSCIHHFMGCDMPYVFRQLEELFPDIAFTHCFMNPIMRKSGLNPDQLMRRQLYSLLKPLPQNPKSVNLVGNDFALDHTSELYTILTENGFILREAATCGTYEEYLQMAVSSVNITTFPAARPAGEMLQNKLGQKHLYLPFSFDYEEITGNLKTLCEELQIAMPDVTPWITECEELLQKAKERIGDTPIAIDYTVVPRPLSLVRLLLRHGFLVTAVYADGFTGDEKEDFEALQKEAPNLMLYPTVHTSMRVAARQRSQKVLAIGQKAAYFTGSDYFVNLVEGGGLYGFDAIRQMAKQMVDAYETPKNARELIQIKGMGCGCCQ